MEDPQIDVQATVGATRRVRRKPAPVGYITAAVGAVIAIIGLSGRVYITNEYHSAIQQQSREIGQGLRNQTVISIPGGEVRSLPDVSPETQTRVADARSLVNNTPDAELSFMFPNTMA